MMESFMIFHEILSIFEYRKEFYLSITNTLPDKFASSGEIAFQIDLGIESK